MGPRRPGSMTTSHCPAPTLRACCTHCLPPVQVLCIAQASGRQLPTAAPATAALQERRQPSSHPQPAQGQTALLTPPQGTTPVALVTRPALLLSRSMRRFSIRSRHQLPARLSWLQLLSTPRRQLWHSSLVLLPPRHPMSTAQQHLLKPNADGTCSR